jgi:hypothetical protein
MVATGAKQAGDGYGYGYGYGEAAQPAGDPYLLASPGTTGSGRSAKGKVRQLFRSG